MLPLIAPRPLLVVNGDSDELTPLAGVQRSAAAAANERIGTRERDGEVPAAGTAERGP